MPLICLHNKKEIEKLLEQDPYLNIYGLGDLDERFRPYTLWYGWTDNMSLAEVVCVYRGSETPTVLAFSKTPDRMLKLLNSIRTLLPGRFYAHLSPGLEEFFRPTHNFEMEKAHYKMALTKPELLDHIDSSPAVRLGAEDVPLLSELYMSSYPGNWFEPDKIGLNRYFGIKENGRLIGAAGTHVYSQEYRAAAVGKYNDQARIQRSRIRHNRYSGAQPPAAV